MYVRTVIAFGWWRWPCCGGGFFHDRVGCWRVLGRAALCWWWQIVAESTDESQLPFVEDGDEKDDVTDRDLVGEVYGL